MKPIFGVVFKSCGRNLLIDCWLLQIHICMHNSCRVAIQTQFSNSRFSWSKNVDFPGGSSLLIMIVCCIIIQTITQHVKNCNSHKSGQRRKKAEFSKTKLTFISRQQKRKVELTSLLSQVLIKYYVFNPIACIRNLFYQIFDHT